ncbi:MAG TPA: hypothetical protein HPP51_04280 [Planctomycetes bacterium]|nr:hypothetical protein [Planctomycetota bacterium]
MTRKKRCVIVFLAGIFSLSTVAGAVSTREIDAVRQKALLNKEVLESADLAVIDAFWEEALTEMLYEVNLSNIVSVRSQIFARRGNPEPSQYSEAFIDSGKKHLTAAFDELQKWQSDERKVLVEQNLIILAAQLESSKLLELGMRLIGHENSTVRYWAVKAVTNQSVVRQLNSDTSLLKEPAARIIEQLEVAVEKETNPEILSLIATFAGRVNGAEAKELLTKIVDLRTIAYENWTVKYELMDAKLLVLLGNEILSQSSKQAKSELGRKFAQLYSYAMQRYILGENILSEVCQQQLASVLIEVEQSVLDRLLGRPQSSIRKAVERILIGRTDEPKDYTALQAEHDALLGSSAGKGELGAALNFDYGKDPDGSAITSPKKLAPPVERDETEDTDSTETTDEGTEAEEAGWSEAEDIESEPAGTKE